MKPGHNRGRNNFKSKLTEEEVLEIHASTSSQASLAKHYKVSQATINHIKKGRTWKWLTHHGEQDV
jgi:hypothetical protein